MAMFGRRRRPVAPKKWICPECRRPGDEGFCPKCGKAMEDWRMTTKCPKCLDIVEELSFCPRCGCGLIHTWNIMPDVATIEAMGKGKRVKPGSWAAMSRRERRALVQMTIIGLVMLLLMLLWGK